MVESSVKHEQATNDTQFWLDGSEGIAGYITAYCVILEERNAEPPYEDGKLINREMLCASLDYDEAREVYDSHKEFWADKSRFRVVWHQEYVKPEMARKLRGEEVSA